MQDNKPIAYTSRSMSTIETYYSQIEKDTLAIVLGCERFHQYLFAKEVKVHTDHKPIVNVLKRPLHESPARIQRMLLRLLRYNLELSYVPGEKMKISDMLSRDYITKNMTDDQQSLEKDSEVMICNVI